MNPTQPTPTGPIAVDTDAAFLGCLMRCDVATARQLLAGMGPNDVAQPIAGEILTLAIGLVARGLTPGPAVLLAEARRTGRLDTEHKHQLVADWLIDTYRAAPDSTVGPYLKTAVLEAAYRRALRSHAHRILARVDHADTTELADLTALDDHTVDLENRHRHAIADDTARPIPSAARGTPATGEISAITERLSRTDQPPTTTTEDMPERTARTNSAPTTDDRRNAA